MTRPDSDDANRGRSAPSRAVDLRPFAVWTPRALSGAGAVVAAGLATRFGKAAMAAAGLAMLLLGMTALEAYAPVAPQTLTRASGAPDDALLARIGDRHIFLSDLELLARAKGEIAAEARLALNSGEARRLLEETIDQHLLARRALDLGLQDDVDVRVRLRAAHERILASAFLEREVGDRVAPDTVYSIYESQNALLELGDEIRARQIVVATRNAAQDAMALLRGGADFATLAREISIESGALSSGGDLGYFTAEAMAARAPALARAAFSTPVGEIAGPIETPEGWRLIRVEERRPVAKPEFEDVRDDIEYFLTLQSVRAIIDELRRGVDMEVFDENFDPSAYAPVLTDLSPEDPAIAETGTPALVDGVEPADAPGATEAGGEPR